MSITLANLIASPWKIIYDPSSTNLDLGATGPGGISFDVSPSLYPLVAEDTGSRIIKQLNRGLESVEVSCRLLEVFNYSLWNSAVVTPAWITVAGTASGFSVKLSDGTIGKDLLAAHGKKWHLVTRGDATRDPYKVVLYNAFAVSPISFVAQAAARRSIPLRLFCGVDGDGNYAVMGHSAYLTAQGLD